MIGGGVSTLIVLSQEFGIHELKEFIFDEVVLLQQPSVSKIGKRGQSLCKNCLKKGHTAKTCPNKTNLEGRTAEPQAHSGKRISPEDIADMKDRINSGVPVSEIAQEFGVSEPTIYTLKKKMNEGIL